MRHQDEARHGKALKGLLERYFKYSIFKEYNPYNEGIILVSNIHLLKGRFL